MADITFYPSNTNLTVFDWSLPAESNPRLAAPISSTATTITLTNAPKDKDGNVVTEGFLMGVKNSNGYVERIYVPAAGLSADGLTITGATRGIAPSGLDYTTGSADFAADHGQDSAVSCVVDAFLHRAMIAALNGSVASGGADWKIGRDTDEDITVIAANGDANEPWIGYDASTNKWIFSNDGVSSTDVGGGTGTVTGGDGITVTAGDIDVDTTDTTTFVTAATADKVPLLDGSGHIQTAQMGATYAEVNQVLSGVGATVTDTNLDTLTDASDASALHVHDLKVISATRDMTAASASVDYAHGLSVVPKKVRIDVIHSVDATTSNGVWDGTTTRCIFYTATKGIDTSNIVKIGMIGTGEYQTATITVDATNITLAWTKTSNPTGSAYLLITAEA